MSFEAGLQSYLEAHAGLKALISERVYPDAFPPGCVMPCLTHQIAGGTEWHIGRYQEPSVIITIWATTPDSRIAVDAQLYEALEKYHGLMGTVHVRVYLGPPSDGHDGATGLYSRRRTARPFYQQPTP